MRKSVRGAFVLGVILLGSAILWRTGRTVATSAGPMATRSSSSAAPFAAPARPGGDARPDIVHAADRIQPLRRAADLEDWKSRIDLLCSLEADLIEGDPKTTEAIRTAYFEAREGLQKGLWAILLGANLAEIETLVSEWPKHLPRERDIFRTLLLYGMTRHVRASREEALSYDNRHAWERRFPAIAWLANQFLPEDPTPTYVVTGESLEAKTSSITGSGIPTLHDWRSVYDPRVRKFLLSALEDVEGEVMGIAISAVSCNMGDTELADDLVALAVSRSQKDAGLYLGWVGVKRLTPRGFERLADFIRAHLTDEKLVRQAMWIVQAQRSERAEDLLVHLFHATDNVELKVEVLAPHWPDKDSKLTQLAFSEARNPDWRIRCEALKHLGCLSKDRGACEAIRNAALADEIPGVRGTCVDLLARISPPVAGDLEILRRIASGDPNPHVAEAAAAAVRRLSE